MEEAHPLAVKLSFSISLGLLPITLSMNTVGCGIRNSGLPEEEAGDLESSSKNSNPLPVDQFIRILFCDDITFGVHVFKSYDIFVYSLYGKHFNMHLLKTA